VTLLEGAQWLFGRGWTRQRYTRQGASLE